MPRVAETKVHNEYYEVDYNNTHLKPKKTSWKTLTYLTVIFLQFFFYFTFIIN